MDLNSCLMQDEPGAGVVFLIQDEPGGRDPACWELIVSMQAAEKLSLERILRQLPGLAGDLKEV